MALATENRLDCSIKQIPQNRASMFCLLYSEFWEGIREHTKCIWYPMSTRNLSYCIKWECWGTKSLKIVWKWFRRLFEFLTDKNRTFLLKHSKPRFITFVGINVESRCYITVGVVNTLSVDNGRISQLLVGWLCKLRPFQSVVWSFCRPTSSLLVSSQK